MRWRRGDSPGNFVSQEGREARKAFSIISSFREGLGPAPVLGLGDADTMDNSLRQPSMLLLLL